MHTFLYVPNSGVVGGGAFLPKWTSGPFGVKGGRVAFISVKECHVYTPVNGILLLYRRNGPGDPTQQRSGGGGGRCSDHVLFIDPANKRLSCGGVQRQRRQGITCGKRQEEDASWLK